MLRDDGDDDDDDDDDDDKEILLHLFVCHGQLKIVDNVCFEKMVLGLQN